MMGKMMKKWRWRWRWRQMTMTMTMTNIVIDNNWWRRCQTSLKFWWRSNDDLGVSVNHAALWFSTRLPIFTDILPSEIWTEHNLGESWKKKLATIQLALYSQNKISTAKWRNYLKNNHWLNHHCKNNIFYLKHCSNLPSHYSGLTRCCTARGWGIRWVRGSGFQPFGLLVPLKSG